MKRATLIIRACLGIGCILSSGCGEDKEPSGDVQQTPPITLKDLPAPGDQLVPMDDGRVVVTRPAGWKVSGRDSRRVVRFCASPHATYPHISITAEDYENVFDVSADNIEQFAKQIAAAVKEDPEATKVLDPVKPMEIGQFVGVRHRRRRSSQGVGLERVFLDTVVSGRKYTIELRTLIGNLEKHEPYLWMVAKEMEFVSGDTDASPADDTGASGTVADERRENGPADQRKTEQPTDNAPGSPKEETP